MTKKQKLNIHRKAFFSDHRRRRASIKKERHSYLSAGLIKRRLYHAGIRGIHSKDILQSLFETSTGSATWSIIELKRVIGSRLTSKLTRLIYVSHLILDEYGCYASNTLAGVFSASRSIGFKSVVRTQDVSALQVTPEKAARRIWITSC